MKAEYIPPREDVILQNEAPDDVYIIVSGEVEIIDCEMEKERVVGTLQTGDMFGEVGALCCKPQSFTYRTKTFTTLEAQNQCSYRSDARPKEKIIYRSMLKNLIQVESGEEEGDPNMAANLLTVASTGNAAFL
ncbi:Potassium channel [Quillaja saponaria]|uniref:Potassium channel n=1 Tax=Quillaja saponaria TaxID=32244 RepID=A0AAD7PUU0_QUISA|nr:Potassium channel [Quillaja saponaria]